jgi:hypothetical protein
MRYLFGLVLTCVLFAFPAFAETGTILCGADVQRIPVWTTPGSPYLVDSLACGQTVTVIAMERGYWRIQFGDKFAYVDPKNLTTSSRLGRDRAFAIPQ